MLMAFSDKSLSPHLPEDFCFTWHRLRGGYLEDIHSYNEISMNSHSWYPPSADDLGSVVVLHCEDTLGLGLSRQLESASIQAEQEFVERVESIVEQNKVLERVVISSCNHRYGPPFRPFRHRMNPSDSNAHQSHNKKVKGTPSDTLTSHKLENGHGGDTVHLSDDDDFSDSNSSLSDDSNVTIPEFEVGGSIAVNSEGILLRERGTEECGLHIDCTNYMSLTCIHPSSFVIELPLYYACSEAGSNDISDNNDPLAPISSIRDLTSISTMRPSVEWIGGAEGEMYHSLQDVVSPDENPLEKSLEELGGGLHDQDYDLLFSSLRLQVACRDRATRDALVLAIRSLAGYIPPPTVLVDDSSHVVDQKVNLSQRLSVLPWRAHSPTQLATTSRGSAGSDSDLEDSGTSCEHKIVVVSDTPTENVPSVNAEVTLRDKRIRELEGIVGELTAEKDSVLAQEESRRKEVEALQAQLEDAAQGASEMRELMEKDIAALSEELTASAIRADTLQEELNSLETERSGQDEKIIELAELVKELESSRVEEAVALEAVQEKNFALLTSLEESKIKLEQCASSGIAPDDTDGSNVRDPMPSDEYEELILLRSQCNEQQSLLKESEIIITDLRNQNTNDLTNTVKDTNSADQIAYISELKKLLDNYSIQHLSTVTSDGDNFDEFMSLIDALRCHVAKLIDRQVEISSDLTTSDELVASMQADHKQSMANFEAKLELLSSEISEKDTKHNKATVSFTETIDGLNESVSVLQGKIKKLEDMKKEALQNVELLQTKCNTLEEDAHSRDSTREKELLDEIEKVTDECNKWNDECLRLKNVMISLQKSIEQKDETAATLKNDFDILSVRLQEVKQHNEMLTIQSERDSRTAKEKTDKLTYELSQATNTVKVMEARITGLQSETLVLSDERQVLKRQKSAFDSSKNQISQLRGQLVESDQTAQATRTLLDETTATNERLKKEHNDLAIELANVNNLLTQKTARIDELKDRIQVMENEITSSDKVKSSFRKENARLKEAAKKLKSDSDTVKTLKPLYNQQLSKIADSHSKIVDLESALCDITTVRNQYALTTSALEMRVGSLKRALRRRELHSEHEGMQGEDYLCAAAMLMKKDVKNREIISKLESDLSEAKTAEPFELKKLNFMVCKLSGEKNHYESKAKSLSKDLQRKLLAGTPLQRELGKMTARLEEVENERNAYRDAMVLACETYSTKEVSSWFG